MVKRKIILLCIFSICAYLFLEYAHGTLLYKEQLHIFSFTRYYFTEFTIYPGGISAYVGEFLTQFLYLGTIGIWLVIALCTMLYVLCQKLYYESGAGTNSDVFALLSISFLPAYCVDPYSQIGAIVALSIAIAVSIVVLLVRDKINPFLTLPICIPLLYMITGSGVYLYTAIMLFFIKTPIKRLLGFMYMLVSIFVLLKIYYTERYISIDQSLLGLSFYRLSSMPILAYLIVGLPIISFVIFQLFRQYRVAIKGSICIILSIFFGAIAWYDTFKVDQEYLLRMDRYANQHKWKELIHLSQQQSIATTLHTSYYNLALLNEGADLTFFVQKQHEGMNHFWTPNQLPLKMMGDLCFESGMTNAARAYWFVANAMTPFGHSAALIQRIAEAELVRGDQSMAQKYLSILETTLFYKSYATQLKEGKYPDVLVQKIHAFKKEDNFWSMEIVDNFQKRFVGNKLNRFGLDFMIYKLLVYKSLDKAVLAIEEYRKLHTLLPDLYQEVLLLYAFATKKSDLIQRWAISQNQIQRFYSYIQVVQSNRSEEDKKQELKTSFGNTYWYYFQYNN